MKHLMKKVNENFNEFSTKLLEFRNTQNISGKSPAQMFFGRRLRSQLPHLPGANDLDIANAKKGAEKRKSCMKDSKNRAGTALPELTIGQKVLTQNPLSNAWENKGVISNIIPTKRSYDVEYDTGETFVRNRKFLRPIHKQTAAPATPANPNSTNYDKEFPPLQIPALRRSTRIANKKKSHLATIP